MSQMTFETEGDRHVVVTRRFAAPPEAVYRAHTEPKLIQKWFLGPEGWTMPVARLYQRGAPKREDTIRMDERRRRRILPDG